MTEEARGLVRSDYDALGDRSLKWTLRRPLTTLLDERIYRRLTRKPAFVVLRRSRDDRSGPGSQP